MAYQVISLNVGKPAPLQDQKREVLSAIHKEPAHERLYLSKVNFTGDEQADKVHHGGEDKAVCVYSLDHYPYWENELGLNLPRGAFGENLTVQGMRETDIHIGDVFQLDEAVVQVSQPRQPCYKLAAKYRIPDLAVRVQDTGFTGFYFRVLQEGWVSPQCTILPLERDTAFVTLEYANQIMHHDKRNLEGIERILAVPALSESWRLTLEKRKSKE
ncbi:MOSC domain-containing protein [Paenibacillus selenitireducens]|uniref:MOSC domain-containing protein n=1 Tax=Paenibacillus selenitireducens TaxID=1324314 RepID=A0A1T2X4K4_9BACL|nr:MOSC domain-containing protein [Paenibacillus selenitireducens]OPA74616.1 MOSC domain-containing protein [Paenibacillus selenitireducens]